MVLFSPPTIYRAFGDRLIYTITGDGLSGAVPWLRIKRSPADPDNAALLTLTQGQGLTLSGSNTQATLVAVITPVNLAWASTSEAEKVWFTVALEMAGGEPVIVDNGRITISPETAFRAL